jgi:hypothetical protein
MANIASHEQYAQDLLFAEIESLSDEELEDILVRTLQHFKLQPGGYKVLVKIVCLDLKHGRLMQPLTKNLK